jgi:hypothetical protein
MQARHSFAVFWLSNNDSLTLLTRFFEGHPRLVSCNSNSLWAHKLMLPRIPWSFLGILNYGAFANWASGAAMHRKITRQSRWNLRRTSDKAIPNQAPGIAREGVETGWRASLGDEGTVRLSSKGESDRITQRSAVQIRPPQPRTPLPKRSGVRPFSEALRVGWPIA